MNLSFFSNLYQNRNKSHAKNVSFTKILQYFIRLKIGEMTGNIYNKKIVSQKIEKDELTSNMKIIDEQTRSFLEKIKTEGQIDIAHKKGFENIGLGCLISPVMFGNLMAVTQGKASFYLPTKINEKYLLKIALLTIPKISGTIEFEDKPVHNFTISTLSDHNISIEIKPEYVVNPISKIFISTSLHWSPKYLDKNLHDFPLGVMVRSIELLAV